MAWQLVRNDLLVLDLCPELKDASFETLGAEMAELGLTLGFDIAAELAQNNRREDGGAARRARRCAPARARCMTPCDSKRTPSGLVPALLHP